MDDTQKIDKILEIIKKEISDKAYKKYFAYGFSKAEVKDSSMVWSCKDNEIKKYIENYYKPFILAACRSLDMSIDNISFVVG